MSTFQKALVAPLTAVFVAAWWPSETRAQECNAADTQKSGGTTNVGWSHFGQSQYKPPFRGEGPFGPRPSPFVSDGGIWGFVDYAKTLLRNRHNWIPKRADADESGHVYTTDGGIPATCEGVVVGSGNKVHTETDFASEGEAGLALTRTYNKSRPESGAFGSRWFSTADYKLSLVWPSWGCTPESDIDWTQYPQCNPPAGARPGQVRIFKPNGANYSFKWREDLGRYVNDYLNPAAYIDEVRQIPLSGDWVVPDEWVHTTELDGVETFTPDGRAISILNKHGVGWFYEYDPASATQVKFIRHSSGRQVEFHWSNGKVDWVRDPDGKQYDYSYTAAGYLSGVTYPGGTGSRTYHYELAGYPHALTGVSVDGVRYSTFTYYSHTGSNRGRVASSELAGGINRTTFVYSPEDEDPQTDDPLWTEVTNVNGVTYKYEYNWVPGAKVLTAVSRLNGAQEANTCPSTAKGTTYDSKGNPEVVTDWNGNTTKYVYNDKRQVTQVIHGWNVEEGERRGTRIDWEANHNAVKSEYHYAGSPPAAPALPYTSNLLREVQHAYYSAPNQAKLRMQSATATDWAPGIPTEDRVRITNYAYDFWPASGILKTMTVDGPIAGDEVTSRYSTQGDLLSVENALLHTTSFGGHNGRGQPTLTTGVNGEQTTITYDARGKAISTTHTANGQPVTTGLAYDGFGTVTSQTINGVQVLYRTTGPTGLIGSERWQFGDSDVTLFEYNNLGLKFKESITAIEMVRSGNCGTMGEPQPCPPQPTEVVKYSKTWTRDAIGRVTAEKGNNLQNVRFEYDGNGDVTKLTDSLGRYTTYQYNVFGEQVKVTQPAPNPGETQPITETGYDALGRVAWVKDPKNQDPTTYSYDGHGNLRKLISPDTGTTDYDYDAAGRIEWMKRANGDLITYDYTDPLGRLKSVTATGAAQTFDYDLPQCTNAKGRVCVITDSSGSTEFDYNDQGLIAAQKNTIAGVEYIVGSSYDDRGRLTSQAFGGNTVYYDYGVASRPYVTGVRVSIGGAGAVDVLKNFTYMARGPVKSWTYNNGAVRNMTYDLDYRLKTIATANIQGLTYTLNAANEITGISNSLQSAATQTYVYDALSRLKADTKTGGKGPEAFTFDANSNRETHTWGGAIDDYHPDPLSNKLETTGVSSITGTRARDFQHDAVGNIYDRNGWGIGQQQLAYDSFGRLKSLTNAGLTTTYHYDASNQRVRKAGATPDIRYLWAGGRLLAETGAGSTTLSTFYIWLGSEPVALIKGGALYYVHNDHLGRPEVVTDAAKTHKWRALNFAYERQVLTGTGYTLTLNIGFPGQYFDVESGLWYNHHRYYDAATGRYITSDPIGLGGGLNTYAYVDASPVANVDPAGLSGAGLMFARPTPTPLPRWMLQQKGESFAQYTQRLQQMRQLEQQGWKNETGYAPTPRSRPVDPKDSTLGLLQRLFKALKDYLDDLGAGSAPPIAPGTYYHDGQTVIILENGDVLVMDNPVC